jgi:hypothetical protein
MTNTIQLPCASPHNRILAFVIAFFHRRSAFWAENLPCKQKPATAPIDSFLIIVNNAKQLDTTHVVFNCNI